MQKTNIFTAIPEDLPEELLQTLVKRDRIHIERIVSRQHVTPENQWYDQQNDEWVMILQGQAILEFEQDKQTFKLNSGDYCLIPAHCKHRVVWTAEDQDTVWLAVHF